jgi:hypothetical protein
LLAIREAHLQLNERKWVFGATETFCIGFMVDSNGIQTENRRIATMRDWPVLLSMAKLRSFLGMAGYYRKFVHKFTHWTTELYTLTTKQHAFWWLWKHQAKFDDIQRASSSTLVLAICEPEYHYILCTDASYVAPGGVLA